MLAVSPSSLETLRAEAKGVGALEKERQGYGGDGR